MPMPNAESDLCFTTRRPCNTTLLGTGPPTKLDRICASDRLAISGPRTCEAARGSGALCVGRSVDDPRALRTILKGVVSATAGATAAPGARAVKKARWVGLVGIYYPCLYPCPYAVPTSVVSASASCFFFPPAALLCDENYLWMT